MLSVGVAFQVVSTPGLVSAQTATHVRRVLVNDPAVSAKLTLSLTNKTAVRAAKGFDICMCDFMSR